MSKLIFTSKDQELLKLDELVSGLISLTEKKRKKEQLVRERLMRSSANDGLEEADFELNIERNSDL